jgi:hypothetical protein
VASWAAQRLRTCFCVNAACDLGTGFAASLLARTGLSWVAQWLAEQGCLFFFCKLASLLVRVHTSVFLRAWFRLVGVFRLAGSS